MVLSDIVLLFSAPQRFFTSRDTPTVHDITYLLEMSHYHEKPTLRQSQTVSTPDHCVHSTVLTKRSVRLISLPPTPSLGVPLSWLSGAFSGSATIQADLPLFFATVPSRDRSVLMIRLSHA